MAGKKRSSAGGSKSTPWGNIQGWKQVEVGEEFLIGSEEFGFMGLEELDASALGKK